jgi:hypothetical protein
MHPSPKPVNFSLTLALDSNRKMKRSLFAIALFAPALLLTSCSKEKFLRLNPPREDVAAAQAPESPPQRKKQTGADPAAKDVQAARQRAWEAAVLAQNPPHSSDTWQKTRVKWRQAIRLLEDIPRHSDQFVWVQKNLPTYRANYAAIDQRLRLEQRATEAMGRAQTSAWQAAMAVQSPPYSLKIWQRASQKWADAIAALTTIPPGTSVFKSAQEHLSVYQNNHAKIRQRIQLETLIEDSVRQFEDVATRFKTLQLSVINGQSINPIGIGYEEYSQLVQNLRKTVARLKQQPGAHLHPLYRDLTEAIADYEFALDIWQSYLDHKRANASWLHDDDFFNQLFPVSRIANPRLLQNYSIKIYQGIREPKIPLKFALWEIWETAGRRTQTTQQALVP